MITIQAEIELTGEELAKEFWETFAEEQADFFNKNKFKESNYDFAALKQIDNFVDALNDDGRNFIIKIYESLKEWYELNN